MNMKKLHKDKRIDSFTINQNQIKDSYIKPHSKNHSQTKKSVLFRKKMEDKEKQDKKELYILADCREKYKIP